MPFIANRTFKANWRNVVECESVYPVDHKNCQLLNASSDLFCVTADHGRTEIANAVLNTGMAYNRASGESSERLFRVMQTNFENGNTHSQHTQWGQNFR